MPKNSHNERAAALRAALEKSNSLLQTLNAIATRQGHYTDWKAITACTHEAMTVNSALLAEPAQPEGCTYPACQCPTDGQPCGAQVAKQDGGKNVVHESVTQFFLDLIKRIAISNEPIHTIIVETPSGNKGIFEIKLVAGVVGDGTEFLIGD